MSNGPANIPKIVLLVFGLGVASYALFWCFTQLREGIREELNQKPFYEGKKTVKLKGK